jgi:hypothetical protein
MSTALHTAAGTSAASARSELRVKEYMVSEQPRREGKECERPGRGGA